MLIQIERLWQNDRATTGKCRVFTDDNIKVFECYSLENPKIGSARGQDLAIPFGKYRCERYESPKFNATLEKIVERKDKMICLFNDELNVPKSARVLIHWGNKEEDTLGCILLGKNIAADKKSISVSRDACKEFYNIFKDNDLSGVMLDIIDNIEGE